MKTLRQSMLEYATKYKEFASDESCFAVRLDERTFMLAPISTDKEVTNEDITLVVMDDFDIAGNLRDKAVFFYDLFLKRKDIWTAGLFKAKYSFELCQAGKTIPAILDDMAQIIGSKIETVDKLEISSVLHAMNGGNACQVRDIGMLVAERSLDELFTGVKVLEKSAECYIKAKTIGGGKHVGRLLRRVEHAVFKGAYSIQNQKAQRALEGISTFIEDQKRIHPKSKETVDNIEKRELLLNILQRMTRDGFVQGTWGNVSVRLDENMILCSPKGIGYNVLRPQDMVVINSFARESKGNISATSEKGIHSKILSNFPQFNAVIHAHPTYASILASAHKDLIIVDEKDKVLLGDIVKVSKYALPSTKALTKQTMLALGNGRAAFMANHGVVVAGEDMDTAYQALTRLEELCKAMF
ncbi:MAG: class II aldolase/adducin family protein [Clostridia bacterium]|nr:class II aldolase/adducin family protein [Clostridia bacterium]